MPSAACLLGAEPTLPVYSSLQISLGDVMTNRVVDEVELCVQPRPVDSSRRLLQPSWSMKWAPPMLSHTYSSSGARAGRDTDGSREPSKAWVGRSFPGMPRPRTSSRGWPHCRAGPGRRVFPSQSARFLLNHMSQSLSQSLGCVPFSLSLSGALRVPELSCLQRVSSTSRAVPKLSFPSSPRSGLS